MSIKYKLTHVLRAHINKDKILFNWVLNIKYCMFPIKLRYMRIKKKLRYMNAWPIQVYKQKILFFIYKIIKFNITIYFNLTEESKVHNLYIYT